MHEMMMIIKKKPYDKIPKKKSNKSFCTLQMSLTKEKLMDCACFWLIGEF